MISEIILKNEIIGKDTKIARWIDGKEFPGGVSA